MSANRSANFCKFLLFTSIAIQKLKDTDVTQSEAQGYLMDIEGLWSTLHFNERKIIVGMLVTNVIVQNEMALRFSEQEWNHQFCQ